MTRDERRQRRAVYLPLRRAASGWVVLNPSWTVKLFVLAEGHDLEFFSAAIWRPGDGRAWGSVDVDRSYCEADAPGASCALLRELDALRDQVVMDLVADGAGHG